MNLFRKIGAMIRAVMASVGQLVLMPVRLADNTLGWIYRLITAGPQVAPVEIEASQFEQTPEPETAPERPEIVGGWARRAAKLVIESDFVLDKDVPKPIADWALCLAPHELRQVAAATDEAVGLHLMGVTPMVGLDGPLPGVDPEIQGPRAAEVIARRLQRERDRQRAVTPPRTPMPAVPQVGRLRVVA